MQSLIYKIFPMLLSLSLTQIIYFKIDKKYEVTKKINLKLRIRQEWKAFFCVTSSFVFILGVGILGIYVIEIPTTVYFILCGIYSGFSIGVANKISMIKNI